MPHGLVLNLRRYFYLQYIRKCINYLEQNFCVHIKRSISFLNINSEWTDPMFDEVLYRASFPFCGFHNSIANRRFVFPGAPMLAMNVDEK